MNSTDYTRRYENEFCRNREYRHVSAHGVLVGDFETPSSSAILLGVGGVTSVHDNSMVNYGHICFVAAGDAVYALSIPTLEQLWCTKVDFATCFGIYWIEELECLISWGEVDVCSLSLDGEIIWTASAADIFTEGFVLNGEHLELIDFNNDVYNIEIETGVIIKLKGRDSNSHN